MATVQVRYIVRDVDAAIAFYCKTLGFNELCFDCSHSGDIDLLFRKRNSLRIFLALRRTCLA